MSDVEGLVRLMREAADGLRDATELRVIVSTSRPITGVAYSLPTRVTETMAYACAILRAVAASVADPGPVPIKAVYPTAPMQRALAELQAEPGLAAICGLCGRKIGVRSSGRLANHNVSNAYRAKKCPGSSMPPEETRA